MAHIMTLKFIGSETEIHLLNPGECFPLFGGSSAGLLVKKTASLITRRKSVGGWSDTEYDIGDSDFWKWFGEAVNGMNPDFLCISHIAPKL